MSVGEVHVPVERVSTSLVVLTASVQLASIQVPVRTGVLTMTSVAKQVCVPMENAPTQMGHSGASAMLAMLYRRLV